jgi:hypothetical protein
MHVHRETQKAVIGLAKQAPDHFSATTQRRAAALRADERDFVRWTKIPQWRPIDRLAVQTNRGRFMPRGPQFDPAVLARTRLICNLQLYYLCHAITGSWGGRWLQQNYSGRFLQDDPAANQSG